MAKASFTVLGCGATGSTYSTATSGYLLNVDGDLALIDCGSGVVQEFLRRKFDLNRLDRIFITHTHSDHVADLPYMIQCVYLTERENPLDIYLPMEFVDVFESYMNRLYLFREKFSFPFSLLGYRDGDRFSDSFELEAHGNTHLAKNVDVINRLNVPNEMMCHSLSISVGARKLFYSADVGSFDDIRGYLTACDYVLVECTHIDINEIIEYAKSADVGLFVVTHLGSPSDVEHLRNRVQSSGFDNIVVAEQGMVLDLS
jgi:ribonuclease Z